ncbi:MAG: phage major capsid protein [Spirochaetota bacterium]|jgi:HK97 family phage major capsid protein|nr:phage major capsid protein [Spirochaetota bacterium]
MDPEIKAAIEEQKKAWKAFQDANDERLKKIEAGDRQGLVDLNAKIEKIQAALDENAKVIERVGEIENNINKMELGGAGGARMLNKAFNAYMRTGDESEFKAAATVQVDPDGGWLVPENVSQEIIRVAQDVNAMRQLAAVQPISNGRSYIEFVTKSGAAAAFVGETESRSETDSPELARIETVAHEMYSNPKASQQLLDDAAIDIGQWLVDEVGIAFAEAEGEAFITGSGVNEPMGLLSYATVADASYAWGKLGYIATGKAADWADTDPEKKLIDLVHALKAKYRNGAAWMMNRSTLGAIRKFKTDYTGYLWQPSLQAGQPSRLLGYPVYEEDNMHDVASAGNLSVAFGNFKAGYRVVDHVAIRVLRDPYSAKPYVSFYTTKRVGGGVRNFEAIKVLKTAAS